MTAPVAPRIPRTFYSWVTIPCSWVAGLYCWAATSHLLLLTGPPQILLSWVPRVLVRVRARAACYVCLADPRRSSGHGQARRGPVFRKSRYVSRADARRADGYIVIDRTKSGKGMAREAREARTRATMNTGGANLPRDPTRDQAHGTGYACDTIRSCRDFRSMPRKRRGRGDLRFDAAGYMMGVKSPRPGRAKAAAGPTAPLVAP